MVRKIQSATDEEIIKLWYQGHSRQAIQKLLLVSAGHISDVIQREKELIGAGNLDALRRLAIEVGKGNNTLVDGMRAIRFLNGCDQNNLDNEEVIECIPHLAESCKKSGIALHDLPLDTETRVEKIKALDTEMAAKEKSAQETQKHYEDTLKKAKQTEVSLEKLDMVMSMLAKRGLPSEGDDRQLEKLENALVNAEAAGYDAKVLVEQISTNRSLKEDNARLASDIISKEKQIHENSKLIDQQKTEIKNNAAMLNELHKLEAVDLGLTQLETLNETVTAIGVKNGMDGPTSVKKLIDDIKNGDYDSILGFAKKVDEIERQCENLIAQHEQLKMDYAADKEAVESVKMLHSKQIKDHQIVGLNNILDKSGISPPTANATISKLEQDIKMWGSIENAVKEAENQHKELLTTNLALKKENEMLECNNDALGKAADNFVVSFEKNVKAYADIAKSGGDEFKLAVAQSVQGIKQANADLAASSIETAKDVTKILDAADEGHKKIISNQQLLDYEPLVKAKSGQQISKEAVAMALVLAIESALPCLNGIVLESIKLKFQLASNELKDVLKFTSIYF